MNFDLHAFQLQTDLTPTELKTHYVLMKNAFIQVL